MATEPFDSWALIELMGHQRIAGRVTEAEIGGCKFVRVDVPETAGGPAMTKFLGPSSIYAITPMSEETCRGTVTQINPYPIAYYDARNLVAAVDATRKELTAPPSMLDDENELDEVDEEEEETF